MAGRRRENPRDGFSRASRPARLRRTPVVKTRQVAEQRREGSLLPCCCNQVLLLCVNVNKPTTQRDTNRTRGHDTHTRGRDAGLGVCEQTSRFDTTMRVNGVLVFTAS